jgi:hypothetical protein
MSLILNFDFFSGFSPESTLSAPMVELLLGQPRFLLPAHDSRKALQTNMSNCLFIPFRFNG